MKTRFLMSALCLAVAMPLKAAELKPYQKEALTQLEATFGSTVWPAMKSQYESVIAGASEEEVKALLQMMAGVKARPDGGEAEGSGIIGAEGNVEDDDGYDRAELAREDLSKQIAKPYDAFMEFVIRLGAERGRLSDEIRNEVFKAEKGGRLQGVSDYLGRSPMVTNRSIGDGMEAMRKARQKLMDSKTFYKVSFPLGSPPDNSAVVERTIREAGKRIEALNKKYGEIAVGIKKRIDAIPYGGGVDVNKAIKALKDEQEGHNKSLSAQVKAIVEDMNLRIAEADKPLFEWGLKPLLEARPQSGPVARN